MNETIITWNVPNFVTVTLMVALGFVVIGALAQVFQARFGGDAPADA